MSRPNKYRPTKDLFFFNLNGLSETRVMFWMPIRTSENREIRIAVRAKEGESRAFLAKNVILPVLAVDIQSEALVSRDLGLLDVFYPCFGEVATVRSPAAFLGLLPDPRAVGNNDRFVNTLNVQSAGFTRVTHKPILHVSREFTTVSSSYLDNIPDDVWEQSLIIPDYTHAWTDVVKNVKEKRITIDFPYDTDLLDIVSDTVPQELINAYASHFMAR